VQPGVQREPATGGAQQVPAGAGEHLEASPEVPGEVLAQAGHGKDPSVGQADQRGIPPGPAQIREPGEGLGVRVEGVGVLQAPEGREADAEQQLRVVTVGPPGDDQAAVGQEGMARAEAVAR
jgi:hypothetical protein